MLVRRVWPSRPTFESPFADVDQIRREMLRLLDAVSGDSSGDVGAGVFPPVNITQDVDNFYLRAEVPGIKPDELSISAVRNRVSLAGKREIQQEHERVSQLLSSPSCLRGDIAGRAERSTNMWWECSECGGHVERARAPVACRECGTAGIIFVPADVGDPIPDDPEADSLRAVWLRAGLEQPRLTPAA